MTSEASEQGRLYYFVRNTRRAWLRAYLVLRGVADMRGRTTHEDSLFERVHTRAYTRRAGGAALGELGKRVGVACLVSERACPKAGCENWSRDFFWPIFFSHRRFPVCVWRGGHICRAALLEGVLQDLGPRGPARSLGEESLFIHLFAFVPKIIRKFLTTKTTDISVACAVTLVLEACWCALKCAVVPTSWQQ